MAKRKKKMKKSKKKMKKTKKAKRGGKSKMKKRKSKARPKKKAKKVKKGKKKARAMGKPMKKAAPKKVAKPMAKPAMATTLPFSRQTQVQTAMTPERLAKIQQATQAVKERMIGKVVHYYDHIGVAIVELEEPLRLGQTVKLKRGDEERLQRITSLQIDHQTVAEAKKGDVVGVKVDVPASEGTKVTWA